MGYNRVTSEIIAELVSIAGPRNVLTGPDQMFPYSHDEVGEDKWRQMPEAVVKPENTLQIAQIMQLANRELIPVTPRGAGTGLAAGAIPFHRGIVLSLERLNRILELDRNNMFMVVEAGVTTGEVQRLAREEGFLYAGDPCSADSSFIGGNIATNAGGNKAVKYGVTSNHVYGLEVVLPQGDILNLGGKCLKDVTGYDLIHLLVGSEGTLGIVTKVYLKLLPRPQYNAVLLAPFKDMHEAIAVVPRVMKQSGIIPTSIEFMDNLCIRSAEAFLERELPNHEAGAYIIIELESTTRVHLEQDMEAVADLLVENGAMDVLVGDNPATQERIWKPRRVLAEALRVTSPVHSLEDIVVPMSEIPETVAEIQVIADRHHIKIACFGHAGDGNIHATLLKEGLTDTEWPMVRDQVLAEIYEKAYARGGTLSGEHGVGAKRKEALARFIDPTKLNLMRAIKKSFDPNLILNPGKVF